MNCVFKPDLIKLIDPKMVWGADLMDGNSKLKKKNLILRFHYILRKVVYKFSKFA